MSVRTVQTSFTTSEPYHHQHKATTRPSYYPPGLPHTSLPSAMNSMPSLLPETRRRSGSFIENVVGHGVGISSLPKSSQRRRTALGRPLYNPPQNYPVAPIKFDPFASDDAPSQAWQHIPSVKSLHKHNSPTLSSRTTPQFTIQLPNLSTRSLPSTINQQPIAPITPPKPDRNARAKIVAGILLNRIYAVGKPMRRRMASSFSSSKTYVPSGLSSVITVEC